MSDPIEPPLANREARIRGAQDALQQYRQELERTIPPLDNSKKAGATDGSLEIMATMLTRQSTLNQLNSVSDQNSLSTSVSVSRFPSIHVQTMYEQATLQNTKSELEALRAPEKMEEYRMFEQKQLLEARELLEDDSKLKKALSASERLSFSDYDNLLSPEETQKVHQQHLRATAAKENYSRFLAQIDVWHYERKKLSAVSPEDLSPENVLDEFQKKEAALNTLLNKTNSAREQAEAAKTEFLSALPASNRDQSGNPVLTYNPYLFHPRTDPVPVWKQFEQLADFLKIDITKCRQELANQLSIAKQRQERLPLNLDTPPRPVSMAESVASESTANTQTPESRLSISSDTSLGSEIAEIEFASTVKAVETPNRQNLAFPTPNPFFANKKITSYSQEDLRIVNNNRSQVNLSSPARSRLAELSGTRQSQSAPNLGRPFFDPIEQHQKDAKDSSRSKAAKKGIDVTGKLKDISWKLLRALRSSSPNSASQSAKAKGIH
jgi:hypothetical protein